MEAAYNTAWGWSDAAKREELLSDAARFIVVRAKADAAAASGTPSPPLLAYVHFRYEVADPPSTDPILYVYEVQLAPAAHRKGLGRFLMQLLELSARRAGLAALTLTVQDCNEGARALYGGLGYVRDEGSPVPGVDEEGFQILVKKLPQGGAVAKAAPTGGAGVTVTAKAGV
jgi:ribosomal protein S18 acetylase RimI-like enzyme